MMEHSSKILRAIEVVYCYSDNDEDRDLKDQLEKHLITMQREGVITTWHRDKIVAGEEWQSEIDKHIDTARIILPLISSDFVSSDKSYEQELKRAIERHKSSLDAHVIPVILRPVDWQSIKFDDVKLANMSVLPENNLAVTLWDNYDEAFLNIAQNIRELIEEIWERDRLGIDDAYHQLKQELAKEEWQKANETTKSLMFKISNQEQTGSLSQDIIQKIPSRDVRVINNVWVQYSRGRFGFTVQQKLRQHNNYQDFLVQIGWRNNDSWLKYEKLDFTTNAPQGHLPYCGVHFWKAEPSAPPELTKSSYYRIPYHSLYQYRCPPNYYGWREEQQRKFEEQLGVKSEYEKLLDSQSSINSPLGPIPNIPSTYNRSKPGGEVVTLVALATKALPWAIGITLVGAGIYAGVKIYENYQKEKEKEEKEKEIKDKINALFSHLDSWTI